MCGPFLNTIMGEFPLTKSEVKRYACLGAPMGDTETMFEPRQHTPATAPMVPPVDRVTFNYGRALGRPKATPSNGAPWERTDHAAEYAVMEDYARAMAAIANKLSAGAWAIDMALMHVRCAETLAEQAAEMEIARQVFHKVDRELEAVHVAPLRYHRYGRIGNVLRRFNPFGK